MSKRPYTEEAYDQIRQTIQEIDEAQISPVTDFFGDVLSRIAQYLKFYTVDTYQDDMQQWYTKILDSHNTAMTKIDELFANAETVDFQYRDLMNDAYNSITEFQSAINCLRDTISGKYTLAEGSQTAQEHLDAGIHGLRTTANAVLTVAEQRMLDTATRQLLKSVISLAIANVQAETGAIGDANSIFTVLDKASERKSYIDTYVEAWGNAASILSIASTLFDKRSWPKYGGSYDDYLDMRFEHLATAEKSQKMDSVTSLLRGIADEMDENLAACPEDSPYYSLTEKLSDAAHSASKVSHVVDSIADGYNFISGVKDTMDTITEIKEGKLINAKEMVEKIENGEQPQIQIKMESGELKQITAREFMERTAKGNNGEYVVKLMNGELKVLTPVSPTDTVLNAVSSNTGIPLSGWDDPQKKTTNVFKTLNTIWSYEDVLLPTANGLPSAQDAGDVALKKIKGIGLIKDAVDLAGDCADLDIGFRSQQIEDTIKYAEYLKSGSKEAPLTHTAYIKRDPYTHSWTKVDLTSRNNTRISGGSGSAGYGGSAGGDIKAALAGGR